MSVLSVSVFEKELRGMCDMFFERTDLPDFPFADLSKGNLSKEQLRDFYIEQRWWETSMIFSGTVLPLLLQRCPDATGRARLWELIDAEYGCGELRYAHGMLARQFLLGLGIPERELSIALPMDEKIKKIVDQLESKSFIELLAGNFLGPETVGPKVFGSYAAMLMDHFAMTKEQVKFFSVHGEQYKNDSNVLFELTARYACTEKDQELARRALREHYERPRVLALCAIRPVSFSYQNSTT